MSLTSSRRSCTGSSTAGLTCRPTTIIENGINIPNANTIIIDRADMYGIAQLYQLRGRVGRSDRTAYAYLFYPAQREISELAAKRLQVIADHTELGAGFKVALKDLEVRGAGNLLGREKSRDINSVASKRISGCSTSPYGTRNRRTNRYGE